MLKAVIVYMQGTGGNLLTRSLCLADNTISPVAVESKEQQPNLHLSAKQKFALYNNWNSRDWTQTETMINIWYHQGLQDFINYELSDLYLVDSFHPMNFENENNKKILWNDLSVWEHIIMITWQPESFDLIHRLARLKRKDLNHSVQLPTEIAAYNRILATHSGLTIAWESMLNIHTYLVEIKRLAQILNLNLDLDLVAQLWHSWKHTTDQVLSNE
jgi:hypothetical protein